MLYKQTHIYKLLLKSLFMKKVSIIATVVIMISLLVTGCDFEVTTANINDIKACLQLSGDVCAQDNPVFSTTDPQICVSCKLKNAPANTLVTFVWQYVEADLIIIDEVTLNSADHGTNLDLNSSLSRPNNGWPIGKYQVEIHIGDNDSSPKIKSFEVR